MTRRHNTHASERRESLGTVIDVATDHHAIPVVEVTPAKLMGDPHLTVQLSEQERKEAHAKAQKAGKDARSKS